jgi:hypothetical protein
MTDLIGDVTLLTEAINSLEKGEYDSVKEIILEMLDDKEHQIDMFDEWVSHCG